MALDTYDNLIKSISKRIERGTSLDTEIDDFILLAEKEMLSNPTESLKISEAETISTALTVITTRFLALPDGFKKMRNFSIVLPDGIGKLLYRTPEQMVIRNNTGTPCFFTIQGDEIAFDIVPEEVWTVTINYFKDFTPLTLANQTNIILDKYPNIYLYGALRQAFIRAQDFEQESIYTGNFFSAIESANLSELESRNGLMPQQTVGWAP
jgi:hypothetical protein